MYMLEEIVIKLGKRERLSLCLVHLGSQVYTETTDNQWKPIDLT